MTMVMVRAARTDPRRQTLAHGSLARTPIHDGRKRRRIDHGREFALHPAREEVVGGRVAVDELLGAEEVDWGKGHLGGRRGTGMDGEHETEDDEGGRFGEIGTVTVVVVVFVGGGGGAAVAAGTAWLTGGLDGFGD